MNKRTVGNEYEEIACNYLENNGYLILERNYYNFHKEIDIIAKMDNIICFVEVKYRADTRFGYPGEAVTLRKQKNIINSARYYLYSHGYSEETPVSFDCILILGNEITLIKNAFGGWD